MTEFDEMVKKVNNINSTYNSDLVKKTDYNTKINEMKTKSTDHDHRKYIASQEFSKLTADSFAGRLKQINLASRNDIIVFIKKHILTKK